MFVQYIDIMLCILMGVNAHWNFQINTRSFSLFYVLLGRFV